MIADPQSLHPTTWRVLRALRAGAPLSRNRHFQLFQDAHARRAIALHRYLRSVARDVEIHAGALDVVRIEEEAGRFALRIDFPRVRGTRTAYLSAFELSLLAEDAPAVAELLEQALGQPLPRARATTPASARDS